MLVAVVVEAAAPVLVDDAVAVAVLGDVVVGCMQLSMLK